MIMDKELFFRSKEVFSHFNGSGLASKYAPHYSKKYPSYCGFTGQCIITDMDQNRFIDFSTMGYSILGYNNKAVNNAVIDVIARGSISSLNNPEEVILGELLCNMHTIDCAVKFGLSGSDSIESAVRIARAYTKRTNVLFNGFHGHSDLYLSANLENSHNLDHFRPGIKIEGVPEQLKNTSSVIKHNNMEDLDKINDQTACVVLEPIRYIKPLIKWVQKINALKSQYGFVLIMDEITSGFRHNFGNMSDVYGFDYDMIIYSKSISNGYSFSVLIGKKEIMEKEKDTFLSSTNWSNAIGNVATLNTLLELYRRADEYRKRDKNTKIIQDAVSSVLKTEGELGLWRILFPDSETRQIYIDTMLDNGILQAGVFYPSFGQGKYLDLYLEAFREFEKKIGVGK